ncbi:hypothetical protein SteCoe_25918 [Stentor coeruleus]|uniref:Casein kinase I n=1 Tax=Stentor coeruleus TaxID=5963 RepID=A0A1R2BE40_9CILI|nr:hypothetical protein SteCoe_25918 [Stentor coeruleus]
MLNTVLENKYQVLKLIRQGENHDVYKAQEEKTNKKVAIKSENFIDSTLLLNEAQVLTDLSSQDSFPRFLSKGKHNGKNYIIVDYLGSSLSAKFTKSNGKFSFGCALRIAEQLLYRIEILHKSGYLYNNIKPESISAGSGLNWQSIYLTSFKLSSKYINTKNGRHIPIGKSSTSIKKTVYSSLNLMNRISLSRRDDIESIAYLLIYFTTGTLPWITQENFSDSEIRRKKANINYEVLSKTCQIEFINFLKYAKSLEFNQEPDYEMLRNIFKESASKSKIIRAYDWIFNNEKLSSPIKIDKSQNPLFLNAALREPEENFEIVKLKGRKNKKVMFGETNEIGSDGDPAEKALEEKKQQLCRNDTIKLQTLPEIQNRNKIIKMRRDFLATLR